jgi:hypothetical protein
MAAFFMAGTPADQDLKAGGPPPSAPGQHFNSPLATTCGFATGFWLPNRDAGAPRFCGLATKAELDNRVTKVHLLVTFAARLRFAATG